MAFSIWRAGYAAVLVAGACACGDGERPSAPRPLPEAGAEDPCGDVASTFEAIQRSVFDGHGCSVDTCHGTQATQGGLVLSAGRALEALVDVPAQAAAAPLMRVQPGGAHMSALYLKLAAATLGDALPAGLGSPMPAGGAAPIPEEKLEAIRLWILAGAPARGVVKGTETLLGCELPEATPPAYVPLEPPPRAQGYQLHAPAWPIEALGEDEVCFATAYDLSDDAPASARVPCPEGGADEDCIAYRESLITQTAQSHHSNVYVYLGAAAASDPSFGAWTCLGGELAGMACDPTEPRRSAREGGGDCGLNAGCTSAVRSAPGCVGWGPADSLTKRRLISGAQTARARISLPAGVYGVMPIKGIVVWNSHGFNLTTRAGAIEMTVNLLYASDGARTHLYRSIFDDGDLLNVHVPPFSQRELCRTLTLERGTHLHFLTGHMHKRGTLFRIWDPPQAPCRANDAACVPPEGQPFYESRRYDDQTILAYDPPRTFDHPDAAQRTLRYCTLYDNGSAVPERVKRRSQSPQVPGGLAPGGPCSEAEVVCLGGDRQGVPCGGDDALCTGGGSCDACPLKGGVTTDDEMLLLMGGYHLREEPAVSGP